MMLQLCASHLPQRSKGITNGALGMLQELDVVLSI